MRAARHHLLLGCVVVVGVGIGCGTFLDVDESAERAPRNGTTTPPSSVNADGGGSASDEGGVNAPGEGDGGTIGSGAPDQDASTPDGFKRRLATFESQQLIGQPDGMDEEMGMELVLPTTNGVVGKGSARCQASTNTSAITFLVPNQNAVDAVFLMRAETLPNVGAEVMRIAPATITDGLALRVDGQGFMIFSLSGTSVTYSPPGMKLQSGSVVKIWVRLDQSGASVGASEANRVPATLGRINWPSPAPIQRLSVGRIGGAASRFAFDNVEIGPPGSVISK